MFLHIPRPRSRRSLLLAGALVALGASSTPAQQPDSKATLYAADLTPALDFLAQRGITNQQGIHGVYDHIEAMFRPMPSEVAAQLIPFNFNNIHVPFELQGDPVPKAKRRPGWQIDAHYIKLEGSKFHQLQTCSTVVHELAHAEFFYFKYRSKSGRLQRQHDLMVELRKEVQAAGVQKWEWPLYQASELAAYYIEASVREVVDRVDLLYTANVWGAKTIQSAAERAALVDAQGRETLVVDRTSPRIQAIFERPAWKVGGRKGDAYYKGEPIPVAVPDRLKLRLYRDVLGLRLPETGEELVKLAEGLDSAWAREMRQKIQQARDERVRELEAGEAVAAIPDLGGFEVAAGPAQAGPAADELSEEDAAQVARIASGEGGSAGGSHHCPNAHGVEDPASE